MEPDVLGKWQLQGIIAFAELEWRMIQKLQVRKIYKKMCVEATTNQKTSEVMKDFIKTSSS